MNGDHEFDLIMSRFDSVDKHLEKLDSRVASIEKAVSFYRGVVRAIGYTVTLGLSYLGIRRFL